MQAAMTEKPSYLGLLNAIAVGETRGHALLSAWAASTRNAAVRDVLTTVAIREREHGAAFAKRVHELGFAVREKPSERFVKDLACAGEDHDDRTKFEQILGYPSTRQDDPLANLFKDMTIDPITGSLLGRFIAEERDSERLLRACYASLAPAEQRQDESLLQQLADRLDRLTATLGELQQLRQAP